MDKIFYNEGSAAKLGWIPSWFGANDFDEELIKKISHYQKSMGVKADGLCGPTTFRRIWTEREKDIEDYYPDDIREGSDESYLLYNNDYIPINWKRVVLPFNNGGMLFTKGYKKQYNKRKIDLGITHWDVCLNAKSCFNVLNRRGLSIHFTIDNDGTIRQHLDINHIALHAGASRWNNKSVGVEVSNAYYPKYQSWYTKHVGVERSIISGAKVHGKTLGDFMGFYPVQLEALKALWESVSKACDIPLQSPTSTTTHRGASSGKYRGFVHHYHLTKNKIDCAGLDLNELFNKE
jgi:hypothetical protein